ELITTLVSERSTELWKTLHPKWWGRYHNHVYGVVGGFLLPIVILIWPTGDGQPNSSVETPIRFADFASGSPTQRDEILAEYQGKPAVWEGYFVDAIGYEPGGLQEP